jgi:hypothetical protein
MSIQYLFTISFIMSMTIKNDCLGQNQQDAGQQKIFQDIQESHLDANIPDQTQFDRLLRRDLEKYFLNKFGVVTVKWEFLREGPTQSGVAYPKYYLWTKIYADDKILEEGAVRVAAMEKTRFEITDFVNINKIKNNVKDLYSIFPKSVCEKIILTMQNR